MTKKAEFNAEEWELVTQGPAIAGMIVITAERGGSIRESLTMGKVYNEAREAHLGPELIMELLDTNPSIGPKEFDSPQDLHIGGLEKLRQAIAVLEEKAEQDEVDSYRGFVMGMGERVAHADKTGGFLGFGGHEVSDAERAALEEIRETIGAHPVPEAE